MNPLAKGLLRLVALALAGAAGATIGALGHAAWLLHRFPRMGLGSALFEAEWTPLREGIVLGAAVAALLSVAFATRVLRLRNVLRDLAGAALGAAAGYLLYVLGFLVMGVGGAGASRFYVASYWGALDTLTVAGLGAAILGGVVGAVVVRFSWRAYGVLAYVAFVSVVVGYFVYAFNVTLPRVPLHALPFSLFLLWAEGTSLAMVVVHTFYGLDNFVKRRWLRTPDRVEFCRHYLPKVALHYACFNEPAEIVIDALARLRHLDYPPDRYVVMVLDDSTDAHLRAKIKAYCLEQEYVYVHRPDRRGFKAGALNHALRLTPRDVEIITVIDADYHVEPEYLRETVGHFIDPTLGFLQTPQDYRNIHQSFLTRQYYAADGYFYRAIMPSRNEANAISFCGTMGMVRKEALETVGGWAEDHVTEDAELSVRLLAGGWSSLYVPKTFGKGLIPPTYDAYKKQHHRWAFGGVRILKAHAFTILRSTRLTLRQRFDWLVSGLHWFDGIYVCVIAGAVAAIAIGEIRGVPLTVYHRNEIFLVGLVPVFLLADGFARLHLALRRSLNLGLLGTLRVMGVWYAIKFVHMRAAFKSLVGFRVPFVRTPKAPRDRPGRLAALGRAVRLTLFETSAALALAAIAVAVPAIAPGDVTPARALMWVWVVMYALIFLAAPLYAYASFRTFTPDDELPNLRPGFQLPGRRRGARAG